MVKKLAVVIVVLFLTGCQVVQQSQVPSVASMVSQPLSAARFFMWLFLINLG